MSMEDEAQSCELREWEYNNRPRAAQTRFQPGEPGYGPEHCENCDTEIPDGRRQWGFQVCVTCATLTERRR